MAGGEDEHGPSPLTKINIIAFFPQGCSSGIQIEQETHKVKAAHSFIHQVLDATKELTLCQDLSNH